MAGETVITVIGNLTSDPELRHTQSGVAVASFTIASTTQIFNSSANQWENKNTLFFRASAWRDLGENIQATLFKGMRVIAQGRLRLEEYKTQSGETRSSLQLDIDDIGPSLRWAKASVQKTTGVNSSTYSAPSQAQNNSAGIASAGPQGSFGAQGGNPNGSANNNAVEFGKTPDDISTPF